MNKRRKILLALSLVILAAFILVVNRLFPRHAPVLDGLPPARTVHFPKDYSLGTLFVEERVSTGTLGKRKLGEARGDVFVPAGKLTLSVSSKARKNQPPVWEKLLVTLKLKAASKPTVDLSPLDRLRPNDLHSLGIGGPIADRDLRYLKRMRSLKELSLNGDNITDKGLAYVGKLPSLEELYLASAKISDAGLAHLSEMRSLRNLYIPYNKITDKGLAHLKGLTSLTGLYLYSTEIGDAGLAHLKNLTSLRNLGLGSTRVTDAGLKHLSGLTSLESLGLGGCNISGDGLKYLKGTNLRSLSCSTSLANDRAFSHLREIESFRSFIFHGMEDEDYMKAIGERIRKALPNCGWGWIN